MPTTTRNAPGNAQRPRHTLSLSTWQGRHKRSQLAGNEHADNSEYDSELQQLEDRLWQDRNAWDIQRRRLPKDTAGWLAGGGFAGTGRFDKFQADRLWRAFLATMNGEGGR